MEFMNIVRMQIQDGRYDEWRAIMDANFARARQMGGVPGMLETRHVRFGPNQVCVIGRWASKEALVAARPMLVQNLDTFRHLLVETPTGATDPISGAVVFSTASA